MRKREQRNVEADGVASRTVGQRVEAKDVAWLHYKRARIILLWMAVDAPFSCACMRIGGICPYACETRGASVVLCESW